MKYELITTIHCCQIHWNILETHIRFTDCKIDCIGCKWFRNIWPQFLEIVWIDFGKELPCYYISFSFGWADSLEVEAVGQLKGRMGLDSLVSHWLKRLPGLDFATFRQCHAIFKVLQTIGGLSREERQQVDMSRIMGDSHGAIKKIMKRVRQTGNWISKSKASCTSPMDFHTPGRLILAGDDAC